MNKVLWMTDIHMKHSNLSLTEELFRFVETTLKERNLEYLIITGDLNDTKSIIRSECFVQLRKFFERTETFLQTFILVGNHDMHNPKDMSFGHSLEILKDIPNVSVIDEPQLVAFDGGMEVKFIPYTEDNKMLMKELKNKEGAKYLFCHNGIAGAQLNAKGSFDDFSISSAQYTKFDRVFVGHYHNYHELENGKITYLGSPFSHSFGESNQDKFIAEINLANGQLDLIKTPIRQHVDIILKSEDHVEEKGVLNINAGNPDNLIRVFLHGTKEDNKKVFNRIVVKDGMKVIFKNEDVAKERIKFDLSKSKEDIIKKYISHANTTLDKKRLVEFGKNIMGE